MNKRCKAPSITIERPGSAGVNLNVDPEHLYDSECVIGCVLERDIAGDGCNPY
jgi:hypothetical protein